jgi:uncharacterized damage-inducible protein DinB
MNIYGLKGLIKALEQENKPADQYLLEFYRSLYQEQLQEIADQVQKQLDQEQIDQLYYKSKAWNDYLAK